MLLSLLRIVHPRGLLTRPEWLPDGIETGWQTAPGCYGEWYRGSFALGPEGETNGTRAMPTARGRERAGWGQTLKASFERAFERCLEGLTPLYLWMGSTFVR